MTDVRLDINELLSRAAWGLDEKDIDMVSQSFAKDAVFVLKIGEKGEPMRFEGHDTVVKLFADSIAVQPDVRRHQVTNVFFESLTETTARVISNLTIVSVKDGAIRVLTSGIYRDDIVFEDGAWRLSVRDLYLDLPY